jgi:hypothetical protein
MINQNRISLAQAQAELVRALTQSESDSPATPKRFDASRLKLAAEALARKRARSIIHCCPWPVAMLGESFPPLFAEFARKNACSSKGPSTDALSFARFVLGRSELPHDVRASFKLFLRRRWFQLRRGD